MFHSNLGNHLWRRFQLSAAVEDLDEAVELWTRAADSQIGPADIRMQAARSGAWALADAHGPAAGLRMYETAIDVLPLLAWHGLQPGDARHRLETDVGSLRCTVIVPSIHC